jgi:hypothetical protein
MSTPIVRLWSCGGHRRGLLTWSLPDLATTKHVNSLPSSRSRSSCPLTDPVTCRQASTNCS